MKPPLCPLCKTKMLLHHEVVHHSLYDKRKGLGIYARDEIYKCPNCFNIQTFGIPITKTEYDKYIELHGGPFEFSDPEKLDLSHVFDKKSEDVIKERLKALGYLDVTE